LKKCVKNKNGYYTLDLPKGKIRREQHKQILLHAEFIRIEEEEEEEYDQDDLELSFKD
jgi:hypothetical protein